MAMLPSMVMLRNKRDPDPGGRQHEDRRKVQQPEESGTLAEPWRRTITESSR
jgi:hypothetical protein